MKFNLGDKVFVSGNVWYKGCSGYVTKSYKKDGNNRFLVKLEDEVVDYIEDWLTAYFNKDELSLREQFLYDKINLLEEKIDFLKDQIKYLEETFESHISQLEQKIS